MCARCNDPTADRAAGRTAKRRFVWELDPSLHCSVLGTCLSHADLMTLARRIRLQIPADSAEHEVHGFFVGEAAKDGHVARAVHKALDQRYEGLLRKAGRLHCPTALATFWDAERDAGRIAGAYWVLLTHPHLPDPLRTRMFGEVHMASHLQGRSAHVATAKASDLQGRLAQLEERHLRDGQRHQALLAERDAEIARLRAQRCEAVTRDMLRPPTAPEALTREARRLRHQARAVAAARERARTAEADAGRLRERIQKLELLLAHSATPATPAAPLHSTRACPAATVLDATVAAAKRRVLYLGGRPGAVDTLRALAADAAAELVHHDGGIEHATARIDGLVEGCAAVFCPIDCISHAACQRAKALCRKHAVPFVPLRSSGATTFARALERLAGG
jgi:hypothetical protein